jgi:hypothetical protein
MLKMAPEPKIRFSLRLIEELQPIGPFFSAKAAYGPEPNNA